VSVSRLSLSEFRSHADAVFAAGPGFVILTGENGAGKTNVLEAVSLLSPGRGLRGAPLSEMARKGGGGGFSVAAQFGDVAIGTGTTATAPERRQVRINGAPASANSLSEWLSILWLTPAMDRLFADTASARRRFLDRLVLALRPQHAMHSTRYDAAMRARNKLLAEEGPWDETWLDSLEAQMAEHGVAVSRARLQTIKSLMEVLWADGRSDFPKARLMLRDETPGGLQARLRSSRKVHAAARRSTHGPNNEDLIVHYGRWDGNDEMPAALCSTGEQKALLIGLILAHADLVADRTQRRPILLLDEIAAHLDPGRRAALYTRLDEAGGQVWMTGTEASLFDGIGEATRFTLPLSA
jgi:DNA replication and repair protein RecF